MKDKVIKTEQRTNVLHNDLAGYSHRQWKINLPGRDYKVRPEDVVPAFAGTIGKISLAGAFAIAWMEALQINSSGFAIENVRLELFLASILTFFFCAGINPAMAPPGTLAPLIPLVPVMAASGVHPLPLAIISGLIAIILALLRAWPKLLKMSGVGTKAGVLILFGVLGMESASIKLIRWTLVMSDAWLGILLLVTGAIGFYILYRRKLIWLAIPMAVAVGLIIPLVFGLRPELVSRPALPILNPAVWWNDLWGIGWGMNMTAWLAALPYALLIVIMWPLDAIAITAMHERSYGEHSERLLFKMDPTFLLVGLRNIAGTILGGSQTAAVWRSFLIPLGVVRRPLPGAALLLAIFGVSFSLLGFPLDLALFAPLLNLVLIFGVFLPMLLTGIVIPKSKANWITAAVCVAAGYFWTPLAGWVLAVTAEFALSRLAARKKRGRL